MSRHIVARRRHIHRWSDGRGSEEQAARRSVKRLCRATDTAADNDDVASAPDWTFAPPPLRPPWLRLGSEIGLMLRVTAGVIDAVRMVHGAGFMKRSNVSLSVRPSVSLYHRSTAATAAGGFAGERAKDIGRQQSPALSSSGQRHVDS